MFLFNFNWFIFKDFSHSYFSKVLIWFLSCLIIFSCIIFCLINLAFLWSDFFVFIGFLFRFLIACFDSLHLIAAYFLDYSISSPLQKTLFQYCSILFWIAFYFSTSYKKGVPSNRNKGWSPANHLTKTLHNQLWIFSADYSHSEYLIQMSKFGISKFYVLNQNSLFVYSINVFKEKYVKIKRVYSN